MTLLIDRWLMSSVSALSHFSALATGHYHKVTTENNCQLLYNIRQFHDCSDPQACLGINTRASTLF